MYYINICFESSGFFFTYIVQNAGFGNIHSQNSQKFDFYCKEDQLNWDKYGGVFFYWTTTGKLEFIAWCLVTETLRFSARGGWLCRAPTLIRMLYVMNWNEGIWWMLQKSFCKGEVDKNANRVGSKFWKTSFDGGRSIPWIMILQYCQAQPIVSSS